MKSKFNFPYDIASSASVESVFGELKRKILKFEVQPMSADRFVAKHLLSIDSNTKLFRSTQLRNTSNDCNCESYSAESNDDGMQTDIKINERKLADDNLNDYITKK